MYESQVLLIPGLQSNLLYDFCETFRHLRWLCTNLSTLLFPEFVCSVLRNCSCFSIFLRIYLWVNSILVFRENYMGRRSSFVQEGVQVLCRARDSCHLSEPLVPQGTGGGWWGEGIQGDVTREQLHQHRRLVQDDAQARKRKGYRLPSFSQLKMFGYRQICTQNLFIFEYLQEFDAISRLNV